MLGGERDVGFPAPFALTHRAQPRPSPLSEHAAGLAALRVLWSYHV